MTRNLLKFAAASLWLAASAFAEAPELNGFIDFTYNRNLSVHRLGRGAD